MGAASDKKEDVFVWVKNVLYSCETFAHYSVATKLVKRFITVYGDGELALLLKLHRVKVWDSLVNEQTNKKK